MKRKITGLFLVLAMLLLPESVWAEGEEQGSKTVITSVDELLKFAKAVNAGDYDEKTDAVVVLDADLDLSGVEWTPIGQANASGDIALVTFLYNSSCFLAISSAFLYSCEFSKSLLIFSSS